MTLVPLRSNCIKLSDKNRAYNPCFNRPNNMFETTETNYRTIFESKSLRAKVFALFQLDLVVSVSHKLTQFHWRVLSRFVPYFVLGIFEYENSKIQFSKSDFWNMARNTRTSYVPKMITVIRERWRPHVWWLAKKKSSKIFPVYIIKLCVYCKRATFL